MWVNLPRTGFWGKFCPYMFGKNSNVTGPIMSCHFFVKSDQFLTPCFVIKLFWAHGSQEVSSESKLHENAGKLLQNCVIYFLAYFKEVKKKGKLKF